MAQQQDNQTQNQPWHDSWQQQPQQQSSQQQGDPNYNPQAYGTANPNYSYYQYPQQAGDQSYYQNYYQYPSTSASSAPPASGTSQYQYDYSSYGYPNGSNYGSYGDYAQYSQHPQQAASAPPPPPPPLTTTSEPPSTSPTSQHAYSNNYYYPNGSNNQWNDQQSTPSQTAATTTQGYTASTMPPRDPPSYIKVSPTDKPKQKPPVVMMSSAKKFGKPDSNQEVSSSAAQIAGSSGPPLPKHASSGTIQSTAPPAKPPSMESWPPSLKEYVEEVFNNCIPERRDEAEKDLRNLILEKHREGTLMTTDWASLDLPLACGAARFRKTSSKKKQAQKYQPNVPISSRKRKDPYSTRAAYADEEKRQSRQKRFQREETPRTHVAHSLQHLDINQHDSIVGTSSALEKNYFRLTSAPDPTTVRPPNVLKKTLELLKKKWRDEQNYTYICDQFKSMRQDLTVQRIRDEFTVTVYEIHARIALEKGDLGEYNQCQSQLKQLYAMGIQGNVMEFTAYRILYYLHTQNWSDINSIMFELTTEQKQNDLVKHALQVRSALSTSNYHRFFELYLTAPQMGGYLMDQFVERERVRSMLILCKAIRPKIPLSFLKNELGFENDEDVLKFLKSYHACILSTDGGALDTKSASPKFAEGIKRFLKIDIKGQV